MQQSKDETLALNDAGWRGKILEDAKNCVLKDRNTTYGAPEDNFARIAELWNAYLRIRPTDSNAPLNALDVAHMMSLMKLARLAYNPTHVDSFVDFAGYVACAAGISLAPRAREGKLPSQQELFDKHSGTNERLFVGEQVPGKGVVTEAVRNIVGPASPLPNDTAHRGLFFIDPHEHSRNAVLRAAWTSRSFHPMADLAFCIDQKEHATSVTGLLGFIEISASSYHANRTFTAGSRWFQSITRDSIDIDRINTACLAHNVTIFILS